MRPPRSNSSQTYLYKLTILMNSIVPIYDGVLTMTRNVDCVVEYILLCLRERLLFFGITHIIDREVWWSCDMGVS